MDYSELSDYSLQEQIDFLEGAHFEQEKFRVFDFEPLQTFQIVRIRQVQITNKQQEYSCFLPNHSMITALFALQLPLRLLVQFHNRELSLNLLINDNERSSVLNLLYQSVHPEALDFNTDKFTPLQHQCCFSGIPHSFRIRKSQSLIYSLTSTLGETNWQLLVISIPQSIQDVQELIISFRKQIEKVEISYLHGEVQQKNRVAQHYVRLLEFYLKRFQKGIHSGIWKTAIFFLSGQLQAVNIATGIVCSHLQSENPLAIPMRSHYLTAEGTANSFCNFWTAEELVSCFQIPQMEIAGLSLKETVAFDVDSFSTNLQQPVLEIGVILDNQRRPCLPALIKLENLNKHTLVAGVTGSGKTNTIFQILVQGWKQKGIPFLVIEPAKAEYRSLNHVIPELKIYTLGYEHPVDSFPLRLNPFYCPQGVPLQTHIDHLKSVFFSSFVLYAPMPYVLEKCLYHIYLDRGWNLITSNNHRGMGLEAYPTLDDLYNQIAPVVEGLGYGERLTKDIRAALETRINSLRMGAKGLMLNTSEIPDFENLFNSPTILELRYMGNEDEKSFLMALILIFLYEYRESQQSGSKKPLHLLVIEEAHRLLRNIDKERRSDESNARAQAIESFTNILAEIRAYRQGVIIADQIVTLLAPEVLKNTNLKIAHRIVALDERETLGQAMVCNDKQRTYLAQLKVGETLIYQEGMDAPNLVRVHFLNLRKNGLCSKKKKYKNDEPAKIAARKPGNVFHGDLYAQILWEFAGSAVAPLMVSKILLATICGESTSKMITVFLESFHMLHERLPNGKDEQPFSIAIHYLIKREMERRGQFYNIKFDVLEEIIHYLMKIATHIEEAKIIDQNCIEKQAREIREIWLGLRKNKEGPFSGCFYCRNQCLFRYEGNLLARNRNFDLDLVEALGKVNSNVWKDVQAIAEGMVEQVMSDLRNPHFNDILVCYLNHKFHQLGLSRKKTYFIIKEINRRLSE